MRPDIVIAISEIIPDNITTDFTEALAAAGEAPAVMRTPPGPFAGLEVYLPAAVGVFIASSYFGGMLTKLGEEHYQVLKAATVKLWERTRPIRSFSVGTRAKVEAAERYSSVFAVTVEVRPQVRLKLVFEHDVDPAAAATAIYTLLDLARAANDAGEVGHAVDIKGELSFVAGTAVVTSSVEPRCLIAVDPLAERRIAAQSKDVGETGAPVPLQDGDA